MLHVLHQVQQLAHKRNSSEFQPHRMGDGQAEPPDFGHPTSNGKFKHAYNCHFQYIVSASVSFILCEIWNIVVIWAINPRPIFYSLQYPNQKYSPRRDTWHQ